MRTSGSNLACQELRSCHSILTSKKLSRLKNQQFYLDTSGKRGHKENCFPPKLKIQEVDIGNHNLSEQKSPQEPVSGQENLNCNRTAGGSVRTSLRDKNCRRIQSQTDHHTIEFYLYEFDQVLTVSIRKNSLVFPAKGGGRNHF